MQTKTGEARGGAAEEQKEQNVPEDLNEDPNEDLANYEDEDPELDLASDEDEDEDEDRSASEPRPNPPSAVTQGPALRAASAPAPPAAAEGRYSRHRLSPNLATIYEHQLENDQPCAEALRQLHISGKAAQHRRRAYSEADLNETGSPRANHSPPSRHRSHSGNFDQPHPRPLPHPPQGPLPLLGSSPPDWSSGRYPGRASAPPAAPFSWNPQPPNQGPSPRRGYIPHSPGAYSNLGQPSNGGTQAGTGQVAARSRSRRVARGGEAVPLSSGSSDEAALRDGQRGADGR